MSCRTAVKSDLHASAPLVPVSDLTASAAFYEERLGFERLVFDAEAGYALMARRGARIALIASGDAAALQATETNIAAVLWTTDLDALWGEVGPNLADLPAGRVRPPFRQPYGVREFHVKDPDGFLMFFSEERAEDAPARTPTAKIVT